MLPGRATINVQLVPGPNAQPANVVVQDGSGMQVFLFGGMSKMEAIMAQLLTLESAVAVPEETVEIGGGHSKDQAAAYTHYPLDAMGNLDRRGRVNTEAVRLAAEIAEAIIAEAARRTPEALAEGNGRGTMT